MKKEVAPDALPTRIVINLANELIQDRILSTALMMKHRDDKSGVTHMIYDMHIVIAFEGDIKTISFSSVE